MTPLILSPRFDDALQLALDLHRHQVRKKTGAPYFLHLMAVCSLVLEQGGDEEQAIAAILHDAPEDQGGRPTLEKIRTRFGDRVARLVEALSDSFETDPDKKLDWTPRKTAYLAQLRTEPDEVKLISLADKVHNASNIVRDLMTDGPLVWDRFKAGRDGTLWYYRELVDTFADYPKPVMVAELRRLVDEMHRLAG